MKVSEERIGSVRALRVRNDDCSRGTVLHLHGGGYRMGSPDIYVGFASEIAARCSVQVVLPTYRLAPEHPYPAGLADALTALEALSDNERASLVLSGDSAGGGLAAALTGLALSRDIRPRGTMLFARWVDLTVSAASYAENAAHDPLFSPQAAREAAEQYLQGAPSDDPLVSPIVAEIACFPPTLISVGAHEVLRDDALGYAAALRRAGAAVELICTPHMEHVAVTRDPALHGAGETFAAIVRFLGEVLQARAQP
jgi:acetyl esterase/lipase